MSAPVKHTCPDIDALINSVRELLKIADNSDESIAEDACYLLKDFEWKLEKLRDSNSSLRSWGEELESEVDKLEGILNDNKIDY
jgi:hypothetical protein